MRFGESSTQVALYISPGLPGRNRFTADVARPEGWPLDTTQTVVRLAPLDHLDGQREILLMPQQICTADGEVIESDIERFDAVGTALSMAGTWQIELEVHTLGEGSERLASQIVVPTVQPGTAPDPPIRFSGIQSALAFLTGSLAIALAIAWLRGGIAPDIRSLAVVGLVALVAFTLLALWQGRITHTPEAQARNPVPRTFESVQRGEELYREYCLVCHGEDGQGTGDLAPELDRRPADLTAGHMDTHPVGDIAWWIRDGIEPAMPGFERQLTEEDVWHLVNYLRHLRDPVEP